MPSVLSRFVLLVLLVLGAGAVVYWQSLPADDEHSATGYLPPVPARTQAVAVFPFRVEGSRWRALDIGLAHLLGARLGGNGDLRRSNPQVVLRQARTAGVPGADPAAAAAVARSAGAQSFILGTARQEGRRLRVRATWTGTDGSGGVEAEVDGDGGDLPALVDQLAARLTEGRVNPQDVRVARVGMVTSEVPEALQAWFEGEEALLRGDPRAAAARLDAATALDPQFALAYFRLAQVAHASGDRLRAARARVSSLLLSNRLPTQEQLLVGAELSEIRRDAEAARDRCRAITAAAPDEWEAWLCLARVETDRAAADAAHRRARELLPALP